MLRLEGSGLGSLKSVTVAETRAGGVACVQHAADPAGKWMECKVAGDLTEPAKQKVDLGGRAWRGVTNVTFASGQERFNASFAGTGEPFVGDGGLERELWGFKGGQDYMNFGGGKHDFWKRYGENPSTRYSTSALKDVQSMVWAMRHSGRPPTHTKVMADDTVHGSPYDDLSDEFGSTSISYYSAFFQPPANALYRFPLQYIYKSDHLTRTVESKHSKWHIGRIITKVGGKTEPF